MFADPLMAAPGLAPAMPAPAPAVGLTPAMGNPITEQNQRPAPPVAQRSFMGYAQQKQNDPANWVTLTNQGAVRNLPIVQQLQTNLQRAIKTVYGPGYSAQVYSGGQPAIGSGQPRVGSTRHDGGMAADLYVIDPQGNRVTGDKLAGLGRHWLENRLGGVGLEMRGGGIHLDLHANKAPIWTYGPVSPAQAALVREFGGRAPAVREPTMVAQTAPASPRAVPPAMARAGAPQPATPGYQVVPNAVPDPVVASAMGAAPTMGLAQMFFADTQRRADQARREKEEEVMRRRRALLSGPSPFG